MTRPTVVLADDHRLVLEGLKRLLEDEFEVLAAVEDGDELIEAVARLKPDLVVADISMPERSGIAALKDLRASDPDARVVLLTMHRDEVYAASALDAGASGYVLKHGDPEDLVRALRAALAGEVFLSPALSEELVRSARAQRVSVTALTERQRAILSLISKGLGLKQVANELGISVKTVEYHKYRMMEQLGVKTSAELIRLAVEHEADGV